MISLQKIVRQKFYTGIGYLIFTGILLMGACTETDSAGNGITENTNENPFSLGRVGNPENIEAVTKPGVLLKGGSQDVEEAMEWLIEQSGNGDIVIIRASGGDGYNSWLLNLGSANSVETLLIDSNEAANDERVAETIRSADALFIAGGNQANYINFWENSKTEEAIQYLIHEKEAPVGGTSAGCAILGEFVFSALNGTITSEEALGDPFDERITVQHSGLVNHPLLNGVITDQHFSQREREGRTAAYLARIFYEYGGSGGTEPIRAIAVDERTALVINESGDMKVLGENNVYFIYPSEDVFEPEIFEAGQPLTWGERNFSLGVFRAAAGSELPSVYSKPESWTETWKIMEGELIREAR